MGINERMEMKWGEITATKNEREALFENFEDNKDKISKLYFEVEIKKLQYMLLKRDQLAGLKTKVYDSDSVTRIEKLNETCVELLQKNLIEKGYEERLKQEGIV